MEIKLILFGGIIGIANIIPGVSGGTMAVILNIYDKLVSSISNIRVNFKSSLTFLLPIALGGGIGVLIFSKIIEYTLYTFPVATNLVFIGLILGSLPLIGGKCTKEKLSILSVVFFFIMLGVMLYMGSVNADESGMRIITHLTALSFVQLFVTSIVAAGAMIIPGLSGSFILLLLGTYGTILAAISNFNILILIPVGLGCIVGVLLFAKIITKMFEIKQQETYSAILGLMVGSIYTILPTLTMSAELFIGLFLASIAAYIVYKLSCN